MYERIYAENYRAFGDRVDLEIRPITLLFGRNGAGKSSLLSCGKFLHGEFGTPVQGRGEGTRHAGSTEPIVIGVTARQYPLWAEPDAPTYDALCREGLDSISVLPVRFETTQRSVPESANFFEILKFSCVSWAAGFFESKSVRVNDLKKLEILPRGWLRAIDSMPEILTTNDTLFKTLTAFRLWLATQPIDDWQHVGQFDGLLGYLGEIRDSNVPAEFHTLIVSPFVQARWCLETSSQRHIGPIRTRNFKTQTKDSRGWYGGAAAFDFLQQSSLDALNEWLRREDRLDLQCELVPVVEREFLGDLPDDGISLSSEELRERVRSRVTEFLVKDFHTGSVSKAEQVGTGISQLVPVIAAGFTAGQLTVEQPELHVHPATQSAIGDFLISSSIAIKDPDHKLSWLVETHSEHLLLRIMRRIRETARGTIDDENLRVRPRDVAVYFFERQEGQPHVSRLEIDEGGDFQGGWPRGFFADRLKELY